MKKYLIVESEGLHRTEFRGMLLALELARNGCKINLWLIQDAMQHLQFKKSKVLNDCLMSENIEVYVDQFSLKQRGVSEKTIKGKKILLSTIGVFAQHLLEKNSKAIWH